MHSHLIFLLTLIGALIVGAFGYQVLSDMNEAITATLGAIG